MGDLIPLDPDISLVRFYKGDDEFQRDAFAGSAPAKNAKRFARANVERNIPQNLLPAKRFRHLMESNGRNAAIDHRALSGNMKKMNLIKSTSRRMISNDEITTLLVA